MGKTLSSDACGFGGGVGGAPLRPSPMSRQRVLGSILSIEADDAKSGALFGVGSPHGLSLVERNGVEMGN